MEIYCVPLVDISAYSQTSNAILLKSVGALHQVYPNATEPKQCRSRKLPKVGHFLDHRDCFKLGQLLPLPLPLAYHTLLGPDLVTNRRLKGALALGPGRANWEIQASRGEEHATLLDLTNH